MSGLHIHIHGPINIAGYGDLGDNIMATLSDILVAVEAEKTVVDRATALLTQLHSELSTANANNDSAAIQTILDDMAAQTAALSSAVASNPDPAPTTAPVADTGTGLPSAGIATRAP